MKKLPIFSFIIAAFLAISNTVLAQPTGSSGIFTIYNNTHENTVIGFYTNDGHGWSSNWLSEDLRPGESAQAQFSKDTGDCEQTLQVGWLGSAGDEVLDDPIGIDICDASNIYLEDNDILFD